MLLSPGLDDPGGDDLEPQLGPDLRVADVDQLQLHLVADILDGRRPRLDDALWMELVGQVVCDEEMHCSDQHLKGQLESLLEMTCRWSKLTLWQLISDKVVSAGDLN